MPDWFYGKGFAWELKDPAWLQKFERMARKYYVKTKANKPLRTSIDNLFPADSFQPIKKATFIMDMKILYDKFCDDPVPVPSPAPPAFQVPPPAFKVPPPALQVPPPVSQLAPPVCQLAPPVSQLTRPSGGRGWAASRSKIPAFKVPPPGSQLAPKAFKVPPPDKEDDDEDKEDDDEDKEDDDEVGDSGGCVFHTRTIINYIEIHTHTHTQ